MMLSLRRWFNRLRFRLGWYNKKHAAKVQKIVSESKDLDDMIEKLRKGTHT